MISITVPFVLNADATKRIGRIKCTYRKSYFHYLSKANSVEIIEVNIFNPPKYKQYDIDEFSHVVLELIKTN